MARRTVVTARTFAQAFGIAVAALAATAVLSVPSAEAAPRLIETHRDWQAFMDEGNGQKTCFVISKPTQSAMNPAGRRRGPAFIFVTNRPGENVKEEISVVFGYPLAANSTRAEIGSTTFQLFAQDETAWVQNAADEPNMVTAMRAGSSMRVFGTSSRGTTTVDTYSLSGITAALRSAASACG
ncbi:MAG: invasion associated locus B family protein [Pseudomonadota bacterium]